MPVTSGSGTDPGLDSLCDWTATDLLAAFSAGKASPVEATEAVLARIARLDPQFNAFCLVDAPAARAAARASERRWRRGEPQGLLDGVPVSVKDLLLTAGQPTLRGSRAVDPAGPWTEDAPAVARLREHGAVLIGKTTTPEFGWKGVTDSPLTGITRNPHDPDRTAGGSSGGSAAAVALGLGPLSVGNDGGGSIRIPASFCGVFGLKPTYGRVPLYPPSPFGTLSHAGPISRTVADAALLLDVISAPDPRDWSELPPAPSEFRGIPAAASGDAPLAGLRVAYAPAPGGVPRTPAAPAVHPEVAAPVAAAVRRLAELGAEVEEADPGYADPVEAFHTLWFSGAAKVAERLTPRQLIDLDPGLFAICREGARRSALDYLQATDVRMALGIRMGAFHQRYDLLVTPTLPIPAFAAGRETPSGEPDVRWTSWTPFSYPFNLTQQPAATLPCGRTADGLPVGVQLVAARHRDDLVLRAAAALERALGPQSALRPPAPAGTMPT
jgi:aspartyl-tRNA(Asn)/glutamyl-tRNA(Gln) amidotransferase subunit A